jgi:hypothetical protein
VNSAKMYEFELHFQIKKKLNFVYFLMHALEFLK